MGVTVGRWEGDTLVLDSVGFIDTTWIGRGGFFHSSEMKVVEKFTRQGDALLYDVTIEDPEVLLEPWVFPTRTVRRNTNANAGLMRERGNCETTFETEAAAHRFDIRRSVRLQPDPRGDVLMTKWTSRFVVVCACLLVSASLYAHHSLAGVYALGKEAKITGAFKAFRLINPHSALKVDVKGANGASVEWNILGGSVQQLARLGSARADRMRSRPGMKSPSPSCRRSTAESGWTSGGDHLPGRAHGPFPLSR